MASGLHSKRIPVTFSETGVAFAHTINCGKNKSELNHMSTTFFADEPFVRNFVNSSLGAFLTAQQEYKTCYPDPVPQKTLTVLSRMYRGFILELCQNLKDTGDVVGADLYTNVDFLWNFCEIMFLTAHPDFPVLPYLVEWINVNFDLSRELLPAVLDNYPDLEPEHLKGLWDLIYSHVFHGVTDQAANLLQYVRCDHGTSTSSALDRKLTLMAELLMKKPVYNPIGGSVTEFEALWTTWREECQHRLDQRAFYGNEQLTFICKILCGDEDAFTEAAANKLLSWYEFMVMTLNYKFPTTRPSALKGFAKTTLEELNMLDELDKRDSILLHAMEFDILNVLKEIQLVWDNPWFPLHFSDLVYMGGKSATANESRIDYSSVTHLRHHFILDYGSTLMEHPSVWQMGVHYLEGLPENLGRPVIREHLQRKKPESELEAQKVLQIAEKFSFGREIYGVCRQVALEKLKRGQMQNALLWSIKAGDGPLTTHIVDTILFDGDCQIEPSLLDSLRNAIPCADRLLFLSGFCDFRKLMDKKDFRGAVTQLCALIRNDLIPKRIAHKILLNIYQLADSKVRLDAGETSTLMEFLHTKVGADKMSDEEFTRLNSILICNRAQEILHMFKNRRNAAIE